MKAINFGSLWLQVAQINNMHWFRRWAATTSVFKLLSLALPA